MRTLLAIGVLSVLSGVGCRTPLDYPDDATHAVAKDRHVNTQPRTKASASPTPMPLSTPAMRCLACHDPNHYAAESLCAGKCHAE